MAADDGEPAPPGPRRRGRAVKPSAATLGVDLASLDWQRSGTGDGALEVAFVGPGDTRDRGRASDRSAARGSAARPPGEPAVQWVLLRVAGDPAGRVLIYDRTEWQNFVDGAGNGEFDGAAE